mmetsp:Transcript_9712/g.23759  ORF Transcript_9712/g.23759 Transcript_9712/m.23759 type:complete len:262 (-) Transcript_9712:800-1585(-)
MFSMSSARVSIAALRACNFDILAVTFSRPSRLRNQKTVYPTPRIKQTVRMTPTAVNPFTPLVKRTERPNRTRGKKRKTDRMYTTGRPFQMRVDFPRARARLRGTFLMNGRGYQTMIPDRLKNMCANATCMAKVVESIAAMMAVTVVPRFAPSVMGSICSSWTTSNPTRGVKVDVVTDDDCTTIVTPMPMRIAMYPLMSVALCTMRIDDFRSIFWRTPTIPKRQTKSRIRPRMKTARPDMRSSDSVASGWKKRGHWSVFLSQ